MKFHFIIDKTARLSIIIALLCCFSGYAKNKAYVIFSSRPITTETLQTEKIFNIGETINFAVLSPNGFKNPLIRIQIIKKSDKTDIMGYTMAQARDIEIDTSKNYFINSFCLYNAGGFYFRVFSHDDFKKPILESEFWIK